MAMPRKILRQRMRHESHPARCYSEDKVHYQQCQQPFDEMSHGLSTANPAPADANPAAPMEADANPAAPMKADENPVAPRAADANLASHSGADEKLGRTNGVMPPLLPREQNTTVSSASSPAARPRHWSEILPPDAKHKELAARRRKLAEEIMGQAATVPIKI